MAMRFLVLLVPILLSVPVPCGSGDADNAAQAFGFVCRVLSGRNVAVVTSLSGVFPPDSRIRFMDGEGNLRASGIVRSSYPDLAYIALDSGSVDSLKKGFVAYSPVLEEPAKILCRYSMILPLIIDRKGRTGHALPPNTIVISSVGNTMKPVFFHHYAHDFGCRTCHHRDLVTPCRDCHQAVEAIRGVVASPVGFGDCVREKCIGCHEERGGESSDCAWCHK